MDPLLIVLFVLILLALYFLPTIVGMCRKHHNAMAIFVINLLLGWSGIIWVLVLVWAVYKTAPTTITIVTAPPGSAAHPANPFAS